MGPTEWLNTHTYIYTHDHTCIFVPRHLCVYMYVICTAKICKGPRAPSTIKWSQARFPAVSLCIQIILSSSPPSSFTIRFDPVTIIIHIHPPLSIVLLIFATFTVTRLHPVAIHYHSPSPSITYSCLINVPSHHGHHPGHHWYSSLWCPPILHPHQSSCSNSWVKSNWKVQLIRASPAMQILVLLRSS